MQTLILWILALIAIQVKGAKSNEDNNPAPADLFKNFIHSPPPIKDIFIEHTDSNQPSSYYRVKWQPDCMFVACIQPGPLEKMQTISNLADYPTIYSKFANVYWEKQFADLYSWTNSKIVNQETNSITFSSAFYLQTAVMPVLCGGCDFIPIGDITWVGDTFTYTNKARKFWAKGLLSRDNFGRASNLVLSIYKLGDDVPINDRFTYAYYYDKLLSLSFFPSRIDRHQVDEDGKDWFHTIVIHSINVSPEPMPKKEFSLDSLANTTNISDLITVSNNILVMNVVHPGHGIIAHGVRQDPVAPNLYTDYRKRIVRIILFSALLIPIVYHFLAMLARKSKNKGGATFFL